MSASYRCEKENSSCLTWKDFSTPATELSRVIRSGNLKEADLLVQPAIDYYRQNYLGGDSGMARFELGLLERDIQQRHLPDPQWDKIRGLLKEAIKNFGR